MYRLLTVLSAAALGLMAVPAQAEPNDAMAPLRHGADSPIPLSAQVAESSDACGVIVESTVVTAELLACWQGAIRVTGDDLTLDLNGFTVPYPLLIEGDRVVVRNGTLEAPGNEFVAGDAVFIVGSDVVLDRLTVQNGAGFVVEAGPNTTVRNSLFRNNDGVALSQYFGSNLRVVSTRFIDNWMGVSVQWGDGATIENSRFDGNGTGVNVWDEEQSDASGTSVRGNRFDSNGVGVRVNGVLDAQGTTIESNVIRDSERSGVLVTSRSGPTFGPGGATDGGAAHTTVRDNVIQRGGTHPDEVLVCAFWEPDDCVTATANDGITVVAADPVVLPSIVVAGNKTMHNAGHGVAAHGVTDGGRNVAVRNGEGACAGVSCRPR